jgi:hypothetical protein
MPASKEIEGEGNFFVGEEIPAGSVEGIFLDFGDADSLPA